MKLHWQGVFPAVTTQLKRDQSLDLDATARHIEALIASGVSGLVVCGSLGENQALDRDEKRRVVACALEATHGRVPVKGSVNSIEKSVAGWEGWPHGAQVESPVSGSDVSRHESRRPARANLQG